MNTALIPNNWTSGFQFSVYRKTCSAFINAGPLTTLNGKLNNDPMKKKKKYFVL